MDDTTRCVHRPEVPTEGFASLSTAVQRASTIVFDSGEAYAARKERGPDGYSYGLAGTPTSRTLEAQIAALERAARTVLTPSGLSAVTVAMLALLRPGERVLVPDTVYPPVRDFVTGHLAQFGVAGTFYDPTVGSGIASLLDARTRLVWVESPGSTTMEIQDLPVIATIAHAHGALVGCDNSWATPLLMKPLDFGADVSVEAVTKYMGGHSDLLLGAISTREASVTEAVRRAVRQIGIGVSSDDCFLALRGMETLAVRLRHSGTVALDLARWLEARPEVRRVLHPGLPGFPGHALWTRDFAGASGVFSVVLDPALAPRLNSGLSALRLFKIGASWGGNQSLVAPMPVGPFRTATVWTDPEPVLRVSVGLEDPAELRADLEGLLLALRPGTPARSKPAAAE